MKKFLITSGLVALVVGFGLIVSRGPAPTSTPSATSTPTAPQAGTEPATTTTPSSADAGQASPAPNAAATSAPASQSDPAAPATPATDSSAPAPSSNPTPTPATDAKTLSARLPEGVASIPEPGVIGSLDPTQAPYRLTFARSGAGIAEIIFADLWGDVWAETAPGRFTTHVFDERGTQVAAVERAFIYRAGSGETAGQSPAHELMLEQRVLNASDAPMRARLVHYGPGDLPRDATAPLDIRRFHFGYLFPERRDPSQSFVTANGQMIDRTKVSSQIAKGGFSIWPNPDSTQGEFKLSWFGTTDRYFALSVHAPFSPPDRPSRAFTSIAEVQGVTNGMSGLDERLLTSIWTPVVEVEPGKAANFDMGVYAGPLDPRILERREPFLGLNMGELIVYTMGGCCSWCTFAWLADALLWFLAFIHDYVVFDWGLAIIGLVVVVRLILHPMQKKSQIAMQRFSRAMTEMKPELDSLQKRFKDDPARMQQEQMRLFRERGVSPAGCIGGMLPMFAQMPIWMALYAVLFFAFDLRQQPAFFGVFQQFGGWSFLADLSAQDNFFRFASPINLWLFSLSSINLLPILMGIVFYFQQKYMSPPITPNMSEEQIQQQKIMKWMMVILFPIMTYVAPSGLTLYILTSTCIGIVESRIIKKQVDAMDLTVKPKSGKKGFLARAYEQVLERAAEQQRQAAGQRPRGKGR